MTLNLKHLLGSATLAAVALAGSTAAQAADIGFSVSISQPGVYGRVDIGRFPQPALIVQQPVLIHRDVPYRYDRPYSAYRAYREPVYMWVPAGHRQNWARHCGQYRACGVPVYFVRDSWYAQKVRQPRYRDDWRRDDWRRDERGGPRADWRRDDRGRQHEDRRGGDRRRDD